ncbi:hypothetical protein K438DRAFT_2014135 [Mycena galopus ATCC 62051]|nr:hypothetical protein K438DRAFT_2014135 [Mycena galopus ATCC 62051]
MKSFFIPAALAIGAAAQALTINTPTIGGTTPGTAECQPLLITWSGGTGPYIIVVNTSPAGTTPVIEFDGQSGTQVSWTAVNVTENTQLLLTIKDSTGATASSAPFPVTAGSDSCLGTGNSAPPTSGTSTPSTGSSAPPTGTSTPSTGSTPVTNPSSTGGGSAPSSTGTKPPTSASSGASASSSVKSSSSRRCHGRPRARWRRPRLLRRALAGLSPCSPKPK